MQTLHNLYGEDAEVLERLDRAMKKPPRFSASDASRSSEKFAVLHKIWQELPTISHHEPRRFHLTLRRILRARLTLRSNAPQKLTK